MNIQLLFDGLIEVILSLMTCLFIFIIGYQFFDLLTKQIDETRELKENNIAVGIILGSFILGIMLIMGSAIQPAAETLRNLISMSDVRAIPVLIGISRMLLFYFLSGLLSFLILWFTLNIFMMMTTDMDEMKLIKENNYSVALLMGVFIISISMLLITPVTMILQAFTPPVRTVIQADPVFINLQVFLEGASRLVLSVIGGCLLFFLGFKTFSLLTRDIDEIEELKSNNLAVSILASAFIFSIMLLIRAAIQPSAATLEHLTLPEEDIFTPVFYGIIRIGIFFLAAGVISFIIIWAAMLLYMLLTRKIDEMKQIKNKNIAIALMMAVFIISMAHLIEPGLTLILESAISLPKVEQGGLMDLPNF